MRLLARSAARAALLVALASLCKPAVAEDLDLKFDYVVTINATMSGSASDENSRTVWSSRLNHTITVTKSWKNPTLGMGFLAPLAAADFLMCPRPIRNIAMNSHVSAEFSICIKNRAERILNRQSRAVFTTGNMHASQDLALLQSSLSTALDFLFLWRTRRPEKFSGSLA